LLAKEHRMRIFVNSENYFMINMEIIRSEIYTRVDMRGTNHEIKIGNLLRHERTKWIHCLEIESIKQRHDPQRRV
jgi:hypothetical protein